MAKRTTESWESLLDGATPGPWRWYWDHGTMTLEGADTMPVATDLHVHDSDLLAAAPETVAELVRTRSEIEAMRETLIHGINVLDRQAGREVNECEREVLSRLAAERRASVQWLTRILEGHNDE